MATMTSNTLNYHNSKGEMTKNGEEKINTSTWGEFIKRFNQI